MKLFVFKHRETGDIDEVYANSWKSAEQAMKIRVVKKSLTAREYKDYTATQEALA